MSKVTITSSDHNTEKMSLEQFRNTYQGLYESLQRSTGVPGSLMVTVEGMLYIIDPVSYGYWVLFQAAIAVGDRDPPKNIIIAIE